MAFSFIVKPFIWFGYAIAVAFLEIAVATRMPECGFKRLLLRRWAEMACGLLEDRRRQAAAEWLSIDAR